jgi:hypothetical protein
VPVARTSAMPLATPMSCYGAPLLMVVRVALLLVVRATLILVLAIATVRTEPWSS